jgi:hypothetical protein
MKTGPPAPLSETRHRQTTPTKAPKYSTNHQGTSSRSSSHGVCHQPSCVFDLTLPATATIFHHHPPAILDKEAPLLCCHPSTASPDRLRRAGAGSWQVHDETRKRPAATHTVRLLQQHEYNDTCSALPVAELPLKHKTPSARQLQDPETPLAL